MWMKCKNRFLNSFSIRSEWITGQALKKPYPGAPIQPSKTGPMGFNAGLKNQDSQAKIPQFFNFIGSNVGEASTVHNVNVSTAPSMKTKFSPDATLELQNRLGWYYSELSDRWYKTEEQLNKEAIRAAKLDSIIEEESNSIPREEEAWIRAQVREVMNQKFAANRMQPGSNPVLRDSSISGIATSNHDVIDLITQSTASLQKSQPTVIPGSPISLATTSSLTGNSTGFLQLSSGSHPSPPP